MRDGLHGLIKYCAFVIIALLNGCSEEVIVHTDYGNIVGSSNHSVDIFMNIPYAAPPTGENRWRPPQPLTLWPETLNGRVDFSAPGCVQWSYPTGVLNEKDDCLVLHIWRPKTAGPHPVLIYLHGGGLVQGSGAEFNNIGSELAASQNLVVVTVSYRLGLFGFLALPELSAESPYGGSGNYGYLDQLAALEWVKQQIHHFGGDAENITLSGESAGALSTCWHLASPLSQQLFDRAIIQSGPCGDQGWRTLNQQQAETKGIAIAEHLGCSQANERLDCLRGKSAEEIKTQLTSIDNELLLKDFDDWSFFANTTIDGYFATAPLSKMLADSPSRHPVIIGNVSNEGSLFEVYRDHPNKWNDDQSLNLSGYRQHLQQRYGDDSEALANLYPLDQFDSVGEAMAAIKGDEILQCPSSEMIELLLANEYPVYRYRFAEYTSSLIRFLANLNRGDNAPELGVFHGAELPFVFALSGALGALQSPEHYTVAEQIQHYWRSFAHRGDVNDADNTHWPTYNADTNETMILAQNFATEQYIDNGKCHFWYQRYQANRAIQAIQP